MAAAVADQWSGETPRRRLRAAVRTAMVGMGGIWIGLGVFGLALHLVDT